MLSFVPPGAAQDENSPGLPVPVPAQHSPVNTWKYGSPWIPNVLLNAVHPGMLSVAGKHELYLHVTPLVLGEVLLQR